MTAGNDMNMEATETKMMKRPFVNIALKYRILCSRLALVAQQNREYAWVGITSNL